MIFIPNYVTLIESKTRSKRKKCDEDYYSSDEDSFLDRTGTAERKRRERIKGKANCVETYESLVSISRNYFFVV